MRRVAAVVAVMLLASQAASAVGPREGSMGAESLPCVGAVYAVCFWAAIVLLVFYDVLEGAALARQAAADACAAPDHACPALDAQDAPTRVRGLPGAGARVPRAGQRPRFLRARAG